MNRDFPIIIRVILLAFLFSIAGCTATRYKNPTSTLNLRNVYSHSAPVSGGQIEYYRFGSGSPIILIPGYATDISSWSGKFLGALALHHEVIVFNNRNVGRSFIQSSRYDSRDLANDIHQLIQDLQLRKPAVLGISMGGMIAQQFAVLYPDQLSHLILINTAIAGTKSVRPTPIVEKKLLNIPNNKLERYWLAIHLFFPQSSRIQMAYEVATSHFKPQCYKEIDLATVKTQQQHLILRWAKDNVTAKKISRITLPVLILNGEADEVIPPINSVILARTIPHARLVRFQGGGHAMIYQYPEQIANTVNDFIVQLQNISAEALTNEDFA